MRAVLNQKVEVQNMCLKELYPVNTENIRISVALDLPEFQWNQIEARIYIYFFFFLRSFLDKQSSFI